MANIFSNVVGRSSGARGFMKDAWQAGPAWTARRNTYNRTRNLSHMRAAAGGSRNRGFDLMDPLMAHPRKAIAGGGVVGVSSGAVMWNHHRASKELQSNNDSYY